MYNIRTDAIISLIQNPMIIIAIIIIILIIINSIILSYLGTPLDRPSSIDVNDSRRKIIIAFSWIQIIIVGVLGAIAFFITLFSPSMTIEVPVVILMIIATSMYTNITLLMYLGKSFSPTKEINPSDPKRDEIVRSSLGFLISYILILIIGFIIYFKSQQNQF